MLQGQNAESVIFCDYSADNNLILSLSRMGKVVVWNSHTYLINAIIDTEITDITCCKLHPTSMKIAIGENNFVHIVELDVVSGCTGEELEFCRTEDCGSVSSLDWLLPSTAFAVENTIIVSGWANGSIVLTDVVTKAEVMALSGHTGEILCIALCRDGTKLVSASKDKSCRVRLYPLTSLQIVLLIDCILRNRFGIGRQVPLLHYWLDIAS